MKHKKKYKKFNRESAHRMSMLYNLAASLIQSERITTTVTKAKSLRGIIEPLITRAAEDNVHNRRLAYGEISNKKIVHKLFAELGPRYADRPGGYTRVLRTNFRANDGVQMAIIELVDSPVVEAMIDDAGTYAGYDEEEMKAVAEDTAKDTEEK